MNDTKKNRHPLRALALGAFAAITVVGAAAAWAGPGHGGPGGGMWMGRLQRMIQHLDLSEEQEVQAVRLFRGVREKAEATREQHKANRQRVAEELAKPEPDARALHAMLDEMAQARTQIGHEAIDAFLQLHATLTPEQRFELKELMERAGRNRR